MKRATPIRHGIDVVDGESTLSATPHHELANCARVFVVSGARLGFGAGLPE